MTLPCTPVTSLQDISDRGFQPTGGKVPATGERELTVLFRNGLVSRWTYRASQLRWTREGHPWDVVGYR